MYRVSLKKGTFLVFAIFQFQRSDFTFSYVFWNQNFEPVSSSHSNNALGALKNNKKHALTLFLSKLYDVKLEL